MDYSLIFQKVTEVYEECNITELPLDIYKVLEHYGLQVYTYSELRLKNEKLYRICISYSNDAFKYEDVIAYNENMHSRRIPFTLMHELGHILLSHVEENPSNEKEADYFSSNLLAPRILIHKGRFKTAEEIHDTFGLSYAASNRALKDYQNWFQHICHTTQKPTEAEIHLEQIFVEKLPKRSSFSTQKADVLSVKTKKDLRIPDEDFQFSDQRLFAYLKNSALERRKAQMLKVSIDDYLIFRYGFRFTD